jgi:hypothetical protein
MKVTRTRSRTAAITLVLGMTAAALVIQQPNATGPRGASAGAPGLGGTFTKTGAALRAVFDRETPDPAWTAATGDRLAPGLFRRGFELECRASLCALEATFESRDAFRDFVETTFEGRDPTWRGSFTLANADLPATAVAAGRGLAWRAVIFLGDVQHRAPFSGAPKPAVSVRVTPATDGVPGRPAEARGWSVRTVAGIPERTMQNVTASQYRELVVPLARGDGSGADAAGDWRAFVAVGGPDLGERPPQCALEQRVQSGPAGPILIGSSGPRRYDASYDAHAGTIELALAAGGRQTAETVVKCFVPPQGWVGNVVWHLAAAESGGAAASADGPYAANALGRY